MSFTRIVLFSAVLLFMHVVTTNAKSIVRCPCTVRRHGGCESDDKESTCALTSENHFCLTTILVTSGDFNAKYSCEKTTFDVAAGVPDFRLSMVVSRKATDGGLTVHLRVWCRSKDCMIATKFEKEYNWDAEFRKKYNAIKEVVTKENNVTECFHLTDPCELSDGDYCFIRTTTGEIKKWMNCPHNTDELHIDQSMYTDGDRLFRYHNLQRLPSTSQSVPTFERVVQCRENDQCDDNQWDDFFQHVHLMSNDTDNVCFCNNTFPCPNDTYCYRKANQTCSATFIFTNTGETTKAILQCSNVSSAVAEYLKPGNVFQERTYDTNKTIIEMYCIDPPKNGNACNEKLKRYCEKPVVLNAVAIAGRRSCCTGKCENSSSTCETTGYCVCSGSDVASLTCGCEEVEKPLALLKIRFEKKQAVKISYGMTSLTPDIFRAKHTMIKFFLCPNFAKLQAPDLTIASSENIPEGQSCYCTEGDNCVGGTCTFTDKVHAGKHNVCYMRIVRFLGMNTFSISRGCDSVERSDYDRRRVVYVYPTGEVFISFEWKAVTSFTNGNFTAKMRCFVKENPAEKFSLKKLKTLASEESYYCACDEKGMQAGFKSVCGEGKFCTELLMLRNHSELTGRSEHFCSNWGDKSRGCFIRETTSKQHSDKSNQFVLADVLITRHGGHIRRKFCRGSKCDKKISIRAIFGKACNHKTDNFLEPDLGSKGPDNGNGKSNQKIELTALFGIIGAIIVIVLTIFIVLCVTVNVVRIVRIERDTHLAKKSHHHHKTTGLMRFLEI